MKRRLMLAAMSLILTVTLSVTSMNTVAEASPKMSPTEENLEITINSFLESDGAVAEELTDECQYYFFARRYIYHKSCSLQWLSFIGRNCCKSLTCSSSYAGAVHQRRPILLLFKCKESLAT